MKSPMIPDIQAELMESVRTADRPETISVMVASIDSEMVTRVAPMVAARLYPKMSFGKVLWHEPVDDTWSEAAIQVGRDRPR